MTIGSKSCMLGVKMSHLLFFKISMILLEVLLVDNEENLNALEYINKRRLPVLSFALEL